ncbi:BatD family protein [uncultured Flavobacterium sp.]|uniref:BatD family protein n=1 Tax=uncultured Flavobacterium sp. TaxID=165435 RepID=UPI0025EF5E42|nr:BatD family protein [uncultured Flavobacterium sp.]
MDMGIQKIKTYIGILLLACTSMFAQQPGIQASVDSAKIRIGSQFNLTLKATANKGAKVSFPAGKNFGQLEVLEAYPTDTIEKDGLYELVKKYGLTQFDSGRYEIPKLPVIINNKTYQTIPLTIEVNNVVVDTLKQKLYDIKPVIAAESRSWLWLYILGGIIILGGIGYLVFRYLKKLKPVKEVKVEYVSPKEKARISFNVLERKDLLSKGGVKEYYSELANIARTYLEETIRIPAMESTTSELIDAMHEAVALKDMRIDESVYEELEKVLRNADMAKFALSRPADYIITQDRSRVESTIAIIDKSLPAEMEPIEPSEEEKARQAEILLQKKKRQRVLAIIGGVVGLIVGVAIYIGITKGFDFLKDNLLGHPTKELLDAEWVKSEYGVPPVTIETPKVLKRNNEIYKYIPKEAAQNISEMQLFEYGSLFDNFHIAVATMVFKQPADVDLFKAFDATAKEWESRGATGILQKQEGFKTGQGTEGLRAYGTMTLPDPITKEKKRAYYEIMYFKQQQGVQQVMVIHEDGDGYAEEITERIKKSIEFTQEKGKEQQDNGQQQDDQQPDQQQQQP